MEKNGVSLHELKVFKALKGAKAWVSAKDVAKESGVAERTARAHLLKLVRLGIIDRADVFPGHRYRLSDKADKRNMAYFNRIAKALEVFGC